MGLFMTITAYDPINGIVTIEGRKYDKPVQVRLSRSGVRIRTQAVVIDHLVEKELFPDRVSAGRAVKAAGCFILDQIMEAANGLDGSKISIIRKDDALAIVHKGEMHLFESLEPLLELLEQKLRAWSKE